MKSEYIYIAVIGSLILTFVIGIITAPITLHEPVAISIGLPLIVGMLVVYFFTENLRGKTNRIITSMGHFSYRMKDIKEIPFTIFFKNEKGEEQSIRYGTFLAIKTGGIQKGGLDLKGRPHDPIILSRSEYFEKVGHDLVCHAHLSQKTLFEHDLVVDRYLKDWINKGFISLKKKKQVLICNTPFFSGITAPVDKSDTAENIKAETMMCSSNIMAHFEKTNAEEARQESEKAIASRKIKETPVARQYFNTQEE